MKKEEDVRNLCEKAPEHLKWLDEMGVLFDRNEDDTWKVKASGGQSRKKNCLCRGFHWKTDCYGNDTEMPGV